MIVFTTCKINIGLNIQSRRPDGYHNIETLMVPIDWHDILEIVPAKGKISTLTTYGRKVDCPPEKNLVMKAYRELDKLHPLPPVDIYLEKIVPDQAGLGGGSADAAFTLTCLNEMFQIGLTKEQLAEVSGRIGADCPLFIYNRPMLATGTGTTLTPIDINIKDHSILIVKPDLKISTAEAYGGVSPSPWATPLHSMTDDILSFGPANDFEKTLFINYPILSTIKKELYNCGAGYASMSGSGSALFGIFNDNKTAEEAKVVLNKYGMTHICHAI